MELSHPSTIQPAASVTSEIELLLVDQSCREAAAELLEPSISYEQVPEKHGFDQSFEARTSVESERQVQRAESGKRYIM
jgi:hypothetical protein